MTIWGQLDDNITPLVYALGILPGVTTIASCGGHDDPGPTQKPAGEWFVTFEVGHDKSGLLALIDAVTAGELLPGVKLEAGFQVFALYGKGSDPAEVGYLVATRAQKAPKVSKRDRLEHEPK